MLPAKGALDCRRAGPRRREQLEPAARGRPGRLGARRPRLIPAFYERFGDRLPEALWAEHAALIARLRLAMADELIAPDSLVAPMAGRSAFAAEPPGRTGHARQQARAAEA